MIPLITAALLSACATNPDGTMDDQQQTVAEGAMVGAVVGGLLGAVIGDNRRSALAGAAVGGIIGAGIGSSIAERKAQYATEEDFLIAEIQRNEDFIAEADAQNRLLYQEIARLDRESRRLAKEYRAGQVSRDALNRQKTNLEQQLAKAKKVQSLTEKQLADTQQVYQESQQKRGAKDQYTQKLETNLVQLRQTEEQSSQNVASLQQVYDDLSI
ncbi:MAG: glycine zipper 2TM domain-containing protein [Candidatus Competibacteraceae bacterium]|nr:glycine zipper 2TM domain-containing protein [Candidatus Competibacteraceae bacterium]